MTTHILTLPTISERAALLMAVLKYPLEDAPRSIFADWCEEHGEEERAEFIRCQVELAIQRDPHRRPPASWDNDRRQDELWERETALLAADDERALAWFNLPQPWAKVVRLEPFQTVPQSFSYAVVRRGFIDSITCTLADFMTHAGEIFASQPVMRVTLSDREPKVAREWGWVREYDEGDGDNSRLGNRDTLPVPLWDLLGPKQPLYLVTKYYDTRAAALDSLSTACTLYGRKAVGL